MAAENKKPVVGGDASIDYYLLARSQADQVAALLPVAARWLRNRGACTSPGCFHARLPGGGWTSVLAGAEAADQDPAVASLLDELMWDLSRQAVAAIGKVEAAAVLHTSTAGGKEVSYDMYNGVPFSPRTMMENAGRLRPGGALPPWIVEMATSDWDHSEFSVGKPEVRSGESVLVWKGDVLSVRSHHPDDRLLLDLGHDLKSLTGVVEWDRLPEELAKDLEDGETLLESWFAGDRWFQATLGERLFGVVRKEALVIEGPPDLGKTSLLLACRLALGGLLELQPNEALSGANRRTAVLKEAALTKMGVAVIAHDEVEKVDWHYLKQQSNGAPRVLDSVGMKGQIELPAPSLRLLTKNSTTFPLKSAPPDCRDKLKLVKLRRPEGTDPALLARLEKRCPRLARGLCLAIFKAFATGGRPEDLDPGGCSTTEAGEPTMHADLTPTITEALHDVLSLLYEPCGTENGTGASEVKKAIARRMRAPWLEALPILAFLELIGARGSSPRVVVDRGRVVRDGVARKVDHRLLVLARE